MKEVGKFEYMQALLSGREPVIRNGGEDPYIGIAFEALQTAILDPHARRELSLAMGLQTYNRGAERCYMQVVPVLLRMLGEKGIVHAIDTFVEFIIDGAPAVGVPPDRFLAISELARLRRDAHLRSVRAAMERFAVPGSADVKMAIAAAALAGITAEEMQVSKTLVNQSIDDYYYRNRKSLKHLWHEFEARSKKLNAMA